MVTRLYPFAYRNGVWVRAGYPDRSPAVPPPGGGDPTWPDPGTYKPGPGTTGPRPYLTDGVTPRVLTRFDGDYIVNTPNKIVENLDIYGRIILQTNGTSPIIRNCIVRGPGSNFQSSGSNYTAAIASTSASMRNALIEDTRIDLTGRETPWCDAIRGALYTIRRCEITRTVDGLSLTHRDGGQVIEANWIHNGHYDEWDVGAVNRPTSPSDRRLHNDCIQFHAGKNIRIVGNYLGGFRTQGDIGTHDPAVIAEKDAGDDYENSGVMLKQEIDSTLANKIENVLIDRNWFEGGACSLNLTVGNGNDFASAVVTNNRFLRAQPGVHGGYYILRPDTWAGTLTGNVFDDNGQPVTITRG